MMRASRAGRAVARRSRRQSRSRQSSDSVRFRQRRRRWRRVRPWPRARAHFPKSSRSCGTPAPSWPRSSPRSARRRRCG
eukprot:scaffold70785_cov63-Phaeocystis_antarctica.AAC.1